MHEVSAPEQIVVIEFVLQIHIFQAYFPERITDIDFREPVAVLSLASKPDIGNGDTVGESVVMRSEDRAVEKNASGGSELEFRLFKSKSASLHFVRQVTQNTFLDQKKFFFK